MSKTALLKSSFELINRSGLGRLLSPAWGGVGVIFCLHHVIPGGGLQQGFAPNSNLEITPEFLEQIIIGVKQQGYELVSMDAAVQRLASGQKLKQRFAIFTLDDGYRDNLQYAMPVFKKHNCPFTVYVTPRIADGTCELWWRGLEAVIAGATSVTFGGLTLSTDSELQKWQAWQRFAPALQAMPEYEQRDYIAELANQHTVDLHAICRKAAMTWDEIRLMAREPLATIGAHTLNHYNLLKLSADDARQQMSESGQRIAAELGQPIKHFAYPYGNKDAAGLREFEMAKAAGYHSAVVTRLGTVQSAHANHLQALPRVMVSGRYQKQRYIDALVSGVPGRLANKFSGLNVS
jgi:peptidoglycan/xylan/chitin deacetylase (PgdA/CDA1 family)